MQYKQITTSLILLLLCISSAYSQKYLVLDKYGKKRIKLSVGDEIYFKQKNNKVLFHDYLLALKDTTVILGEANLEYPIKDFESFYFPNKGMRFLGLGSNTIGFGFLFAASVYPLVSEPAYSQSESAILGGSFVALGQLLRFFRWKKFKLRKNSRIRILDTTFR
ncbi:hypothetical protein AAG747_25135 [Rapidithrix thailandica]|uniref:Uncharacterized protein n=1 Tax=Rapidithrix thailandica TaxID=413964 RepID=A0AAW9SCU6_9BACT